MIPDRLIDRTTSYEKNGKSHTLYTHLFCIILRVLLGLMVYYKMGMFKNPPYILFILIIIIFSNKLFLTQNKTWKVYLRTIIMYSIIIIMNLLDNRMNNFSGNASPSIGSNTNVSGLLIIMDAMMGLQSRHIQNNMLN